MSEYKALILDSKDGMQRVVPAPIVAPGKHQIAIRARAVAINPVDRYMPALARFIAPWLKYPAVLGSDVAGEVVAVGAAVTRFRIGQRVLGVALGTDKGRSFVEGAFQERVIVDDAFTVAIPDGMAFEDAAVLPLGVSTAASGLFQEDYLGLRHPSTNAVPAGKSVLIWGASTSVGSNAVQLASLAGYDVVATASPRNHDYVRRLGVRAVVDYRSARAIIDVSAALAGRQLAGALAIGEGSLSACISVLKRCEGRRFISVATPAISFDRLMEGGTGFLRLLPFLARMGLASARDMLCARRAGVATKFIWGTSLKDHEVGPMIFERLLPQALAEGRYVAAPTPLIVGHGLEAIPHAFHELAKGVSARKIVVTL